MKHAILIYETCKSELCVKGEVNFQRTTPRYIPEDSTLHNHRCENLRCYRVMFIRINNQSLSKLNMEMGY
jgi:hypothetical protein